jgi:hypothetical protein
MRERERDVARDRERECVGESERGRTERGEVINRERERREER